MEIQRYADTMADQASKRWPQIQPNTKAWIYAIAKKEYLIYIENHGKLPVGLEKQMVINRVSDRIKERRINIPMIEISEHIGWFINIQNGKTILTEDGKIVT